VVQHQRDGERHDDDHENEDRILVSRHWFIPFVLVSEQGSCPANWG
jgi:hypothetical protein